MFGNPGSCVDENVPLKPGPEDDDEADEEEDDDDDELDELGLDPPDEPPPARLSARSEGAVGRSDVVLLVNWQPPATIEQSDTTPRNPGLILVLTHL